MAAIEGKAVDSAAAVVTTAEVKASTPPAADKVERAKAPAISKKQERPARGCHEDAKKTLNSGERKEDARASSRVRAQSVDVKSARKLSTPSKPKVAPEAVGKRARWSWTPPAIHTLPGREFCQLPVHVPNQTPLTPCPCLSNPTRACRFQRRQPNHLLPRVQSPEGHPHHL